MLVISRKRNESIDLYNKTGDLIASVTLNQVRSDQVRLGIEADKAEVRIVRRELGLQIAAEQPATAGAA